MCTLWKIHLDFICCIRRLDWWLASSCFVAVMCDRRLWPTLIYMVTLILMAEENDQDQKGMRLLFVFVIVSCCLPLSPSCLFFPYCCFVDVVLLSDEIMLYKLCPKSEKNQVQRQQTQASLKSRSRSGALLQFNIYVCPPSRFLLKLQRPQNIRIPLKLKEFRSSTSNTFF